MLSYRHAFHAGNFADVLKHLVLIQILEYLNLKDKAWCCVDTHAGGGKYALDGSYALQNREFDSGIGKLWLRDDLPDVVNDYVKLIKRFNVSEQLSRYPGSPLIIKQLLREQDRLFLFELHSEEIKQLRKAMRSDPRIMIDQADGLTAAVPLLPPRERRGLVFIDPSYEMKNDYTLVTETLIKMTKRFATGTYALWYPVVERRRNEGLERALKKSGIGNMQLFELGVQGDAEGFGMTACGMIIINPPWTLKAQMDSVLPWLAEELGVNGAGHFRSEVLRD